MDELYRDPAPERAQLDAQPGVTVLEFGSPTCGHCRRALPLIADAFGGHERVAHIKVHDGRGQPLASTLADYLLPGAADVPMARIDHMETPSPYTRFGQKGIGEGGAIAPPAAIANAVNDALAPLGVEITESPLTPRRIVEAIMAKAR